MTKAQEIEARLAAIEEVVFSEEGDIATMLYGMYSITYKTLVTLGDMMHDIGHNFHQAMYEIGECVTAMAPFEDSEETVETHPSFSEPSHLRLVDDDPIPGPTDPAV